MYGLCPACGSELDDEGNCWVCGYMAHFGSPDDYDYYLGDYYAYLSDLRLSIG